MAPASPALFLDRDGTLNELIHYADSGEWESPRCPTDLRLLPSVPETLKKLQDAGWPLFLISNQPSAAKGKVDLADLRAVAEAFEARLGQAGVRFQATYYCFHHPDGTVPALSGPCACRKPSPTFLLQAADAFGLDLARTWLIGDQDMDVRCGRAAGVRTILIPYSHSASKRGDVVPDFCAGSISELPALLSHLEPL